MTLEKQNVEKNHFVNVSNRNKMSITGVKEVISFNDDSAVINTIQGLLHIKGSNMHLEKFNIESSELSMNGKIDNLIYKNNYKLEKMSLLKRLFK